MIYMAAEQVTMKAYGIGYAAWAFLGERAGGSLIFLPQPT